MISSKGKRRFVDPDAEISLTDSKLTCGGGDRDFTQSLRVPDDPRWSRDHAASSLVEASKLREQQRIPSQEDCSEGPESAGHYGKAHHNRIADDSMVTAGKDRHSSWGRAVTADCVAGLLGGGE